MESQLTILSESLDRKLEVLQKIQEYNKRQEEVFSAERRWISVSSMLPWRRNST